MEKNMSGDAQGNGTSTGARIQSGVNRVSEDAHNVVDRVAGAATHAAHTVETGGQHLKDSQERVVHVTRNYVHENPVTSIAIAVGAGFLLSRLLSSR